MKILPDTLSTHLAQLGGEAEPARLFAGMRLDEVDIDAFYECLRQCQQDGLIEEARPDATTVLIRLVTR